ncbi:MAG: inorganic phosphate transporter [Candidatus Niyogibacteria bacterium]|nr:inorganic phosphate transporter [Candidatus Niyogibacteria bacterium]
MSVLLVGVLLLVLGAEFVNGWTDAPNAIATVVATRVISPARAVAVAIVLNVAGALSGTAVAHTIGAGIVEASVIDLPTIAAALLGLIIWSSVAAHLGLPTSESHALVAGLAGAALAAAGPEALLWDGWKKVAIGLVFSSVIGFAAAWVIGRLIRFAFANTNPVRSKRLFDRMQIFSAAFMAYNHGLNDGQKFIGVFTLALVMGGVLPQFIIPTWVIFLCAGVMGVGTAIGGWRIIRMLGEKMVRIESWQGFSAELAASSTILAASTVGIPLSTTHTITTSIMGAAASYRASTVRWNYSRSIVIAWFLTFPVCGAIAFFTNLLFQLF